MSNQTKLDLIRSLKLGDVVIAGNHIGAIRYLGPLEGNASYNALHHDIYSLYAGIELTEPNGHMNGSMMINNTTISYFCTTFGDDINRKRRKMNKVKNANHVNEEVDEGKYGLLIPAVSIQKKIDSFALLKKITLVFDKYKNIKKRINVQSNQLQSTNSHNTFTSTMNNDIKTNSDLISNNYSNHTPPPAYNGIITNNVMPLSNTGKLTPNKRQKWSLTPNPQTADQSDKKRIALKKMHSFPYTYDNSFVVMHSNDPKINVNDLPADDDFACMTPTDAALRKQLNSSLPRPLRVRLNRGYSYDMNRMNERLNKRNTQKERQRGCSYHVMQHSAHLPESKRLQVNRLQMKRYHTTNFGRINHNANNKIKMILAAPLTAAASTATTSKPSPSPRSHDANNIEIKESESNKENETIAAKEEKKETKEAADINETEEEEVVNEIHMIAKQSLTTTESIASKSDVTFNTYQSSHLSRTSANLPRHHPSSSMYTHGPLNCWTDSNLHLSNKLTSSGGALDKNKDLSSLAIRVSGHVSTRSASYESPHQQHDSQQLKQLLDELKRNKLNDIFARKSSKTKTKEAKEEEEETINDDDEDDLPKLTDCNTTAATVHSPTQDVLENYNVITSITSPEEKLAQVENNEDEKQLISDVTPIPKEQDINIVIDINDEKFKHSNNKKRLSLTETWLRRHNKRKSKIIFKQVNEHRHQQTLSEPMLPKFNLMMHIHSSDEDEKTGSSDGDDDDQDSVSNNLDANEHTLDITEDDVQLTDVINEEDPNNEEEEEDEDDNNNKKDKYTLWSMAASPISRRSSVNDLSVYGCEQGYKTKHEYFRDLTYFNTKHRAQQILNCNTKSNAVVVNMQAHAHHKSIHEDNDGLDIIKEVTTADHEDETHSSRHKPQLSCDTRCAVHESLEIEPYQPPQPKTLTDNIVTPQQSALV